MNKEEVLLNSFSIIYKNPRKNWLPLKSAVRQLLKLNPKLGFKCWEECIRDNLADIESEYGNTEFRHMGVGYHVIESLEAFLCCDPSFEEVVGDYANNSFMLEVIYTQSPLRSGFNGRCAISYLIRNNRLQEADNILAAVYKNKTFNAYARLWKDVIEDFCYREGYVRGRRQDISALPEHIKDYCMNWIEKIPDEEERAGAMTFALRMY